MKRYIFLIGVLLIGLSLPAQNYKIIVNNANSTSSISSTDLSKLFLKKKKKWDNGEKVVPIDQSASSDVRKEFTKVIHKKSVGAIKSYWQQFVFAGSGTPPIEKKSDEEVIAFVKGNSGAIGYVSSGANTSGVKVITTN